MLYMPEGSNATCWLPLVGDPLCIAAGWSGIRLLPALLFIGIGKGARYALLMAAIPVG